MKLLQYFLIFMLCYHILMTGLGGFGIEGSVLLSGGKDFLWIILILGVFLYGMQTMQCNGEKGEKRNQNIMRCIVQVKPLWYASILLAVLSVVGVAYSYLIGNDLSQIVVGFKYTLRPLVVLVVSVMIGVLIGRSQQSEILMSHGGNSKCGAIGHEVPTVVNDSTSTSSVGQYIGIFDMQQLGKLLVGVIILGFVWQGCKVLFPEFFMQFGYGPVGDFIVGESAPIRYRTGPGGTMRRQGIFAGPNNYGYFLTAFASVIGLWGIRLWNDTKKFQSIVVGILFIVAVVLTYSRGAILGVGIQVLLGTWLMKPEWKKYLSVMIAVGCTGIIGLSIRKRGSTVLHFEARFEGFEAILSNPRGYGLGSSGPSVHYEGVYLPENQYLQVALDLGVWGLIGWLGVRFMILRGVWKSFRNGLSQSMMKSLNHGILDSSIVRSSLNLNDYCHPEVSKDLVNSGDESDGYYLGGSDMHSRDLSSHSSLARSRGSVVCLTSNSGLLIPLLLGGIGLAVIGMFLHVLEDSMVNYWYLSLLGVMIGKILIDTKTICSQCE